MSEYITIQPEYGDDPDEVTLITNLPLTSDRAERYPNRAAGEEGSPLAQFLFEIEGVLALTIEGDTLIVRRDPGIAWHALIDDISAALKAFFL